MNINKIEALIEVIKEAGVTEVSVSSEGASVTVRKPPRVSPRVIAGPHPQAKPEAKPAAAGAHPQVDQEAGVGTTITAPMVGIFHMIDGMKSPGAVVEVGQVVGAIESMKLMNDVVADAGGGVVEIYVEDGMPVEYGQALFRLNEV